MELALKRTDGRYASHAVEIAVGGQSEAWCIHERNESSALGESHGGYLESEYFVRGSEFAPLVQSGGADDFKLKALARCRTGSWESDWPDAMANGASTYWQEGWIEGRLTIQDGKLVECELDFTPTGRKEEEGARGDDLTPSEMARDPGTGRVEAWLREL